MEIDINNIKVGDLLTHRQYPSPKNELYSVLIVDYVKPSDIHRIITPATHNYRMLILYHYNEDEIGESINLYSDVVLTEYFIILSKADALIYAMKYNFSIPTINELGGN